MKKNLINNKLNQEIYGLHSVLAALENPKRKHLTLYILNKYKDFSKKYANKVSNISILSSKDMFKLFGNENSNQGIVLISNHLHQKNFEEIFINSKKIENSIVVILDQVTDPNNIGSIMRSCALFNCKTIIVSKNNSPDLTPSLTKSASGAVELINYLKVTNLNRTLKTLKKLGYWIYGLDNSSNSSVKITDMPKKSVIVLGSEGKGIRDLIKKECDALISLPSNPNLNYSIDSLNVSNACAIALYEHFKKFNL